MYTEDELYAELTGSIKQTGQNIKTAVDMAKYINNLIGKEATSLLSGSDASFVFTGQSTDLRYFNRFNEMPISMIENIPDETLKNAVVDEFNKAVLSGKVRISKETGKIAITNAGKKFINKPEFKIAAAQDYSRAIQNMEQMIGFELDGTISDLSFFNHADTLDLKSIMAHSDKETVQKVLSNLVDMKNKGLVTVEGAAMKATAKGKEMLASEAFKTIAKGTATKAASATASAATASTGVGAIFVAIEKGIKIAAKVAKSPVQQK
ncbi:hypothetical protein [Ruminococcus sp.]|uniref:hypothetical protein n=1 Tax=Ruminococcus sp. TaxID=41978 RepID=UPI0025DF138E|nr:hypothetical protein [Ruminococcus sp.]MBQ6252477.1 hypothetical protein [Ruminococcus sp.]